MHAQQHALMDCSKIILVIHVVVGHAEKVCMARHRPGNLCCDHAVENELELNPE